MYCLYKKCCGIKLSIITIQNKLKHKLENILKYLEINNKMKTDKQNEKTISHGVAQMDINDAQQDRETAPENECCVNEIQGPGCGIMAGGCIMEGAPPQFGMHGPHGHRGRRGRRVFWGPPPFGPFANGAPPPPPPMQGHPPPPSMGGPPFRTHGPPDMDGFYDCSPWMPGMPGNMVPAECMGPGGFEGHFPGKSRQMGRCRKWKRCSRNTDENECCESQECDEQNSKDTCQQEDSSASDDVGTNNNAGVDKFEESLGAPPMTHLMMMQMHHLRMAKHHRMMAQQCGKRNQGIIKQRCRAMRKCGVTQEQVKAWKQQMKEWKKANKPCCEGSNEEEKTESASEDDEGKDETMA